MTEYPPLFPLEPLQEILDKPTVRRLKHGYALYLLECALLDLARLPWAAINTRDLKVLTQGALSDNFASVDYPWSKSLTYRPNQYQEDLYYKVLIPRLYRVDYVATEVWYPVCPAAIVPVSTKAKLHYHGIDDTEHRPLVMVIDRLKKHLLPS